MAAIIAIGVLAQLLADRFAVPSIVFLLISGLILGPEGLGVITPNTFASLPAIVGLSVAIIVFEGAFHLRIENIRRATKVSIRLVSIGAAISLLGTALAVRFALGTGWDIAFLIGALLVATGPTVVSPILQVVPVRDRVATALETEGIVNDVTAAILAVVVFKIMQLEEPTLGAFLELFIGRIGTGVGIGVIVAVIIWIVLRYIDLSPGDAPRNARLVVLAGALVAFAAADTVASEAGVAAVATAGVILGNADIPYEEQIADFKGDVTLIVLSFVFIALAALLDFGDLLSLGVGGVIVAAAVILVIRPLDVFVSTRGTDFTSSERLFVSFVGPRGIIPASVATLFAVELQNAGESEAATLLVGTVFLVIFSTVALQGGLARRIAEYLDVIPMRVLIIGSGRVGREVAARLESRGENVVVIENDETAVERARSEGLTVRIGDGTDVDALRSAGIENAKTVVAATGSDEVNLFIGQQAATNFDVEQVICRANDPDNVEAFDELGVTTISSTFTVAQAIDDVIERPAMAEWVDMLGEEGDVQEVTLRNEAFVGRPLSEVGAELPGRCLVVLVTHDGETFVPEAADTLEGGDHLTLVGEYEDVQAGVSLLEDGG
ncbi:cation:proton antiporter [Halorubrum sp. SP9]|uniref:cation:proton antiporter domain-containing protein n=1 Tax=Halorubrum sp. SP9 TaxID=1537267 RepID=UPI0010F8D5BD|nr:cation:proton antiporter [Halorubrum sp. SP9]TKX71416.1 potassium transporter [Halorubrum sp. SP9]